MAKTTGLGLLELATVFDNLKPDVVVTIADRYETLATAVAASYMNIPVAHIQGGEVTGSIDEKVRHAVTKLSDLHLVSTKFAGQRVRKMGECANKIFVTGCPSIDLAAEVESDPSLNFNPFEKYGGVGDLHELQKWLSGRDAASGNDRIQTFARTSVLKRSKPFMKSICRRFGSGQMLMRERTELQTASALSANRLNRKICTFSKI